MQHGAVVECRGRGLEVQTTAHLDRYHFVAEGGRQRRQLRDAVVIGAGRAPHEDAAARHEDVAAVERAWGGDGTQFTMRLKRQRHRLRFAATTLRARARDDRHLIQHHGRVFDEHRIGVLRRGGDALHGTP